MSDRSMGVSPMSCSAGRGRDAMLRIMNNVHMQGIGAGSMQTGAIEAVDFVG